MDRDRIDIGPEIYLTVESVINITIIIEEEEEIIIIIIITEIIETIVSLEIEAMEMVIEGMIDMAIGPTIGETIIDRTMVTQGMETEV